MKMMKKTVKKTATKKPAKKMVKEKKTGEMYASKAAMMKHEKSEGKRESKMEYGRS
jgi:hypothetical protein